MRAPQLLAFVTSQQVGASHGPPVIETERADLQHPQTPGGAQHSHRPRRRVCYGRGLACGAH